MKKYIPLFIFTFIISPLFALEESFSLAFDDANGASKIYLSQQLIYIIIFNVIIIFLLALFYTKKSHVNFFISIFTIVLATALSIGLILSIGSVMVFFAK